MKNKKAGRARVISESVRSCKLALIFDRVNDDSTPETRGSDEATIKILRSGLKVDKYQFSLAGVRPAQLNFSFEQSSIIVIEKLAQPKVLIKLTKKLRCLAPL